MATVTVNFPGQVYTTKVLTYSPIGFYALNEASGAGAAVDSSGNGYDATATNVTFQGDTGPDGVDAATFNGTSSVIAGPAGLKTAIDTAELTIMVWFKVSSAAIWTDPTLRILFTIFTDGTNFLQIRRTASDNELLFRYDAGSTIKDVTATGITSTDWICAVMTVSASGDAMIGYIDGVEIDTASSLGTWSGSVNNVNIGSGVGALYWSGSLALVAVWESALGSAAITDLASASGSGLSVDITSYVETAQGAIGFFDAESHFAQIGTCQIIVNNEDRRFSPAYTGGTYYGKQWINATVTIAQGANTLFKGYIQSVEPQPGVGGTKRATLFCEDLLGWLSRAPLSLPLQNSRQMAYLLKLIGSEVFKTDFAQGTITFTANVDDGDTITIGSLTYTFHSAPAAAYDVLIGTTYIDTAINLAAAVNDDESAGDVYGTNTLRSPEVSADADDAGVVTITALARGTAGNAFPLSTVGTHHHANSLTETEGSIISGTLGDSDTQDGVYLQLEETNGTPGYDYQFDFTDVDGTPLEFAFYGRYDGSVAHTVNVDAWNWGGGSYDNIGTITSSGSDSLHTYTLTSAHIQTNAVRIRIQHTSAGNPTHFLYIDHLYVTATMPGPIDEITLSGSTLSGGTDGPTDFTYDDGVQVFDIAADAWHEDSTNALQAFMDVIDSEFGYGWCDRDGTLRAWDRNEEFLLPAATPALTLNNTHAGQGGEMGSAIYNSTTVTYEPRGTIADQIVAKAHNVISVPGSTEGVRWNRLVKLYEAGKLGTLPAGLVTVRIPFAETESGGRIIGATEVIMPKRGTDYQINDRFDGTGFNYTNTLPPRITVSAVITGSGIECTFSNSALGTLYLRDFQVRGTAVIAYDRQQILREDSDSITAYGKRVKQYHLPLASGEIFATSLAHHLISRHKDPVFRLPVVHVRDALTAIGGVDPLSIEIHDVLSITETQTGVSAQKHTVRGIRFSIGSGGSQVSLEWHLKAVLDQTYWILGDTTYGILGSTTRLAL